MKVGLAAVVTLMLFGFVLTEHGNQEDVRWQRTLGEAMEVTGILAAVTFGLVSLWVWAL